MLAVSIHPSPPPPRVKLSSSRAAHREIFLFRCGNIIILFKCVFLSFHLEFPLDARGFLSFAPEKSHEAAQQCGGTLLNDNPVYTRHSNQRRLSCGRMRFVHYFIFRKRFSNRPNSTFIRLNILCLLRCADLIPFARLRIFPPRPRR